MIHLLRSIDAHAGGQPLRLIVDGLPRPLGRSIAQRGEWLRRNTDRVRRALVREPRGHQDMVAAALTEPVSPGSHAGLIFMDAEGYPSMSGHGIIAAATIAIERGLVTVPQDDDDETRVVFDTAAGTVGVTARVDRRGGERRVDSVAFINVPAFVHTPAHGVRLGTRELRVDIAFGGTFYALVDTEAVGVPLDAARLHELRRLASDIVRELNASHQVAHPVERSLAGVAGVVFTGPPRDPEAHLRNITVTGAAVDRSPGGTGTSAVMAVLDAMGLLPDDQPFVNEGLAGSVFRGRAVRRTLVGDHPAVVTEVEGSAWVTGEHTFFLDEDDPFREGIAY